MQGGIKENANGLLSRRQLDQDCSGVSSVQRAGLKKANAEFKLVCMALNLRRMGAMQMA